MAEDTAPAFAVRDLRVRFGSGEDKLTVVDGVTYEVMPGETLGIVGESGSGKSVTVMSALGLLGNASAEITGSVELGGRELLSLPASERRALLGLEIAMVFQDPISSLDPVQRVGYQIAESLRTHQPKMTRKQIDERVIELLTMVGVPSPEVRAKQYPHEFSGGMCQRVVIAMAIANNPKVLIADEPTTAVDVSVQAQLLEVLRKAARETGAATVLISHDMGVIAEMADRVSVMYGGRVVESGPVADIFNHATHPYTRGLLASIPRLDAWISRLQPIPGAPPDPSQIGTGCAFAPRCQLRKGRMLCVEEQPEFVATANGCFAACHFAAELTDEEESRPVEVIERLPPAVIVEPASAGTRPAPLLRVEGLQKRFRLRSGAFGQRHSDLRAVDGVDFEIMPGETLGLVGESGCGKSTTAKLLMRLEQPTAGSIEFEGAEIGGLRGAELRHARQRMGMVFQDPKASLNPRLTVAENIAEPLRIAGESRADRRSRAQSLLDQVGLAARHGERMPDELSGGQRQRVAIARALALSPRLLIMDEPVSALDVSVQAQVLNLLTDLKAELGLSYLFVSHDLSVVRHVSDRVAVMYLGKIVETASSTELFQAPRHPYTRALLEAVPEPTVSGGVLRSPLHGDPPSPVNPPSGCRFRTRCPIATEQCATKVPLLEPHGRMSGALVACHTPIDEPVTASTAGSAS